MSEACFYIDDKWAFNKRYQRVQLRPMKHIPVFPHPNDYNTYLEFLCAAEKWQNTVVRTFPENVVLPIPPEAFARPSVTPGLGFSKPVPNPANVLEIEKKMIDCGILVDGELPHGRDKRKFSDFFSTGEHTLLPVEPSPQLFPDFESYVQAEINWAACGNGKTLPRTVAEVGEAAGLQRVARGPERAVRSERRVSFTLPVTERRMKLDPYGKMNQGFTEYSRVTELMQNAGIREFDQGSCPIDELVRFGPSRVYERPVVDGGDGVERDVKWPGCLLLNVSAARFDELTEKMDFAKHVPAEELGTFVKMYHPGVRRTARIFCVVFRRLFASSRVYFEMIQTNFDICRRIIRIAVEASVLNVNPLFYELPIEENYSLNGLLSDVAYCGLLYCMKRLFGSDIWNIASCDAVVSKQLRSVCENATWAINTNRSALMTLFLNENGGYIGTTQEPLIPARPPPMTRAVSNPPPATSLPLPQQDLNSELKQVIMRLRKVSPGNASQTEKPQLTPVGKKVPPPSRLEPELAPPKVQREEPVPTEQGSSTTFYLFLFVVSFPFSQWHRALMGELPMSFFSDIDCRNPKLRDKLKLAFAHSPAFDTLAGGILSLEMKKISPTMIDFVCQCLFSLRGSSQYSLRQVSDVLKQYEILRSTVPFRALPLLAHLLVELDSEVKVSVGQSLVQEAKFLTACLAGWIENASNEVLSDIIEGANTLTIKGRFTHFTPQFWERMFELLKAGNKAAWNFYVSLFAQEWTAEEQKTLWPSNIVDKMAKVFINHQVAESKVIIVEFCNLITRVHRSNIRVLESIVRGNAKTSFVSTCMWLFCCKYQEEALLHCVKCYNLLCSTNKSNEVAKLLYQVINLR